MKCGEASVRASRPRGFEVSFHASPSARQGSPSAASRSSPAPSLQAALSAAFAADAKPPAAHVPPGAPDEEAQWRGFATAASAFLRADKSRSSREQVAATKARVMLRAALGEPADARPALRAWRAEKFAAWLAGEPQEGGLALSSDEEEEEEST